MAKTTTAGSQTDEPTTALTVTQQEIAALEAELGADDGAQDSSRPPFLELMADKVAKKGTFVLGTKNGERKTLGDEVMVVYLSRGSEVRAVMEEGADRPDCAGRDGVPYTQPSFAPSCNSCIYNSWPGNRPYKDERGRQCRTKRHIVVDVIYLDEASGQTVLVPAILIVPPTSLKAEKSYRGDLAAMSRIPGAGSSVMNVVTKVKAIYKRGEKGTATSGYEWAVAEFSSEGEIKKALPPDLQLLYLQDKKRVRDMEAEGRIRHDATNDIASAKAFEAETTAPLGHQVSEDTDGGGTDDDLPF